MKNIRSRGLTDAQTGVLLIIPGLAVFAAIILFPFIDAIRMSFTDKSMLMPDYEYVGLKNYIEVFSDPYLGENDPYHGNFCDFKYSASFFAGIYLGNYSESGI